ncbi:Selenocysteine Se-methyltransferase [Bertholletia excelsa]
MPSVAWMSDFFRQAGGVAEHLDYLEAGTDIIITASYQATILGFEPKGFSREESEALLRKSVETACEARDIYNGKCRACTSDGVVDDRVLAPRPILVAASIGSYGAYLADGSEYSGDYGNAMSLGFLKNFHRRRLQVLADSGADLIAFEAVPNELEAQAFTSIKWSRGWIFGDLLVECAAIAEACESVVAVGINCMPPRFIHDLILCIGKEWVQNTGVQEQDFVSYVKTWCEAGASVIGGCCRTTPTSIRAIYRTLQNRTPVLSPI